MALRTIAALYVGDKPGDPYVDLPGVEVWGIARDARMYEGPHPVVAHPPCERWGRYWYGGPSATTRRTLGDDEGCFAAALRDVRTYGGVLEHPEASHAWSRFDLPRPFRHGGWLYAGRCDAWTCCVEQGHYGHRARKATWLYICGVPRDQLPELVWGPSVGERLDEGFHTAEERRAKRAERPPRARLTKRECWATPERFRDLLISLARRVHSS